MPITYNKDWKRPVENKWYIELSEYPHTLDGNKYFKVEVVEAKTKIIEKRKINKSGEEDLMRYELLNLVLKIQDTDYHLPMVSIFAHTQKNGGEWSDNSAKLQDFLEYALEQNKNCLEGEYDYLDTYSNGSVYPNLVGTKLICVIAQTGIRQTNKGNYPEYSFELFDPKGYTVVDKEQGDNSRNSLRITMENLNKKYMEYTGETPMQATTVETKAETVSEPKSTVTDDDLPF